MSRKSVSLRLPGGRNNTPAAPDCVKQEDSHVESPHKGHAEPADDIALLRALQGGCEQCFDILFARYWKLVFAIAWKILRERGEAEDIVQDVFLTIYLLKNNYDPHRASVRTWIAQFAHFKSLLRRRALQTREPLTLNELVEFESGLVRFGPSEGILERAAFVEECLATLNPRQRRTVELVHFDGYTLRETATILKQSLANTRNLYYRGMKAIRSQFLTARPATVQRETSVIESLPDRLAESVTY